jgi:hypothetical protein
VRGCKFESHSVLYYMQDDIKLNKIREGHKSNYYWNKKKNSKGITS